MQTDPSSNPSVLGPGDVGWSCRPDFSGDCTHAPPAHLYSSRAEFHPVGLWGFPYPVLAAPLTERSEFRDPGLWPESLSEDPTSHRHPRVLQDGVGKDTTNSRVRYSYKTAFTFNLVLWREREDDRSSHVYDSRPPHPGQGGVRRKTSG